MKLDNYPMLRYVLQKDEVPEDRILYGNTDAAEILEQNLRILQDKRILDTHADKVNRWRSEILSAKRGKDEHKLFDVISEIELAASLVKIGLMPEFDIKLPNGKENGKELDLKVTIHQRPVYFEVKTAQEVRSEEEKKRVLGYGAFLLVPDREEIKIGLEKIKEKVNDLPHDQVLQYQPLVAYYNIAARCHSFYKWVRQEANKNVLPILCKYNKISALIIMHGYVGLHPISFKRTLICNPKAKVPLTDEEKKLINSLEGFQ